MFILRIHRLLTSLHRLINITNGIYFRTILWIQSFPITFHIGPYNDIQMLIFVVRSNWQSSLYRCGCLDYDIPFKFIGKIAIIFNCNCNGRSTHSCIKILPCSMYFIFIVKYVFVEESLDTRDFSHHGWFISLQCSVNVFIAVEFQD